MPNSPRTLAAKYREMARLINDKQAEAALIMLAKQYEEKILDKNVSDKEAPRLPRSIRQLLD